MKKNILFIILCFIGFLAIAESKIFRYLSLDGTTNSVTIKIVDAPYNQEFVNSLRQNDFYSTYKLPLETEMDKFKAEAAMRNVKNIILYNDVRMYYIDFIKNGTTENPKMKFINSYEELLEYIRDEKWIKPSKKFQIHPITITIW